MKHLKKYKLFESTETFEIESMIRDVLADATDEGIKLTVYGGGGPLKSNHPSSLEVILTKFEGVELFALKDIKTGIDSLINMLSDDGYELKRVDIMDDYNTLHKFDKNRLGDPWEYVQSLIKDNSFQRTYPDRDFPLKVVKLYLIPVV